MKTMKTLGPFFQRNKPLILNFLFVFLGCAFFLQSYSFGLDSISAKNPNLDSILYLFTLITSSGGIFLLFWKLFFYYRLVVSYRPSKVSFLQSLVSTVRIYLSRFLWASLIFFPIAIGAVVVYSKYINPALLTNPEAIYDMVQFKPLYLILLVVYQIIFIVISFPVFFTPLVASTAPALSNRQIILISTKLILFNKSFLLKTYFLCESLLLTCTVIVQLVDSKLIIFILALISFGIEACWAIIVSWQFIQINLYREEADTAAQTSQLPEAIE